MLTWKVFHTVKLTDDRGGCACVYDFLNWKVLDKVRMWEDEGWSVRA